MCKLSTENKDKVWSKASIIDGYDSQKIRKDDCGAWIAYDMFENRNSIFGWEIDHIYPKAKLMAKDADLEDINNIQNLRPLNYMNNDSKGMDYPTYHAKVISNGDKNIIGDYEFEINESTQKIISELFNKYLK